MIKLHMSSSIFFTFFHPKKLSAFKLKPWILSGVHHSTPKTTSKERIWHRRSRLSPVPWICKPFRDRHVSVGKTRRFFFFKFPIGLAMIPLAYILKYGIHIGLLPVSYLNGTYCSFVSWKLFWTPLRCDTASLLCIWYSCVFRTEGSAPASTSAENLIENLDPENGRYIMAVSSCLSLGGSETAEKARLHRAVGVGEA